MSIASFCTSSQFLSAGKRRCLVPELRELQELPEIAGNKSGSTKITEFRLCYMSVKVPFPKSTVDQNGKRQNLIGRLLGPRGISLKQLEMLYGCKILIRGKGSVKDPERERRIRGKPEGLHLQEELHVLIEAQDLTRELCIRKLMHAKNCVEKLLVPVSFDEYKRQQLIQLAIINGTYRSTIPANYTVKKYNERNYG